MLTVVASPSASILSLLASSARGPVTGKDISTLPQVAALMTQGGQPPASGADTSGQPVLTVGGAGGRRNATRIRCADLGESQGDELLRQVRKKLRRDHGFAHGEGNIYEVPCVSSNEKPLYPWANGTCATEPEPGSNLKLDCASGFGTGVFVTGAFGFVAAGEIVRRIAEGGLVKNVE